MESLTTKQIVDKVAKHLLTQKEKAKDNFDSCKYRTKYGKKCAVGCLIKDEHYNPKIEGQGVAVLVEEPSPEDAEEAEKLLKEGIEKSIGRELNTLDLKILRELQWVHDDVDVCDWEYELIKIKDNLKEGYYAETSN